MKTSGQKFHLHINVMYPLWKNIFSQTKENDEKDFKILSGNELLFVIWVSNSIQIQLMFISTNFDIFRFIINDFFFKKCCFKIDVV